MWWRAFNWWRQIYGSQRASRRNFQTCLCFIFIFLLSNIAHLFSLRYRFIRFYFWKKGGLAGPPSYTQIWPLKIYLFWHFLEDTGRFFCPDKLTYQGRDAIRTSPFPFGRPWPLGYIHIMIIDSLVASASRCNTFKDKRTVPVSPKIKPKKNKKLEKIFWSCNETGFWIHIEVEA